jgi:hypothetical protein
VENHPDRVALERTVGQIVLKRMAGQKVGSPSDLYRQLGGKDETALLVFEKAFGDSFDEHSSGGYEGVVGRVKTAFKDALAEEGIERPQLSHHKDLTF